MKSQFEFDRLQTLQNKKKLVNNGNLLYWYRELYRFIFAGINDIGAKRILEIGSGMSPAKLFIPTIITSDILELEHLEHCFDCHDIDRYDGIPDGSLDIIILTNVLHHLENPRLFLERAHAKLINGGMIILVEPYLSALSHLIYRHIHHECLDTTIAEPLLQHIDGPLASANIALPHLIFFSGRGWDQALECRYRFAASDVRFFTGLSYMATGGISHIVPLPKTIYKIMFWMDQCLASLFPNLYSSFFTLRLIKKY